MTPFKKILIANRGEIAVRIIRSARDLGIRTVAVYSTFDRDSLHVEMADEPFCIGGADLAETYLNIEKIIHLAQKTECQAIHPGYGFLAENPAFVKACEKAGIVFIGPDSRAIRLMGNKIESREFVRRLGIPMTEGITGDTDTLLKEAGRIPLPLLVKAAAGGGGKGMRIVYDPAELPSILETTSREAKSYFDDGTVYIEKYIEEPRHIEFQVMGDHFGNAVHLYERECSIQRRYQKIIEETPSPTINDDIRKEMGEAAVKITREIGYRNAGTVEFLVDKNLSYYFLEMNTRVQVEHPVTEMVAGVDIVREQILVAAGNPLSIRQEDLKQRGHAIECRIYAEDPSNQFLPSPGNMTLYQEPAGSGVRVDSGLKGPAVIHSFYDPMIAKLITWGDDRELARERMVSALQEFVVHGIRTNIPFLSHLLRHPAYIGNQISTKFCDEHTQVILENISKEKEKVPAAITIIAGLIHSSWKPRFQSTDNSFSVWRQIGYWRDLMELDPELDGKEHFMEIIGFHDNKYFFRCGGQEWHMMTDRITEHSMVVHHNEKHYLFHISSDSFGNIHVSYKDVLYSVRRNDVLVHEDFFGSGDHGGGMKGGGITSPMPGKVIKVNVSEGDTVKKGDVLIIVEAMKMENNITSPRDGVVEKIHVRTGDMVDGSRELAGLKDEAQ
ncbi:MAG: acetyl-CoA carboxylase biotin carboxylase subunit [Bacteroidales bacterium]|nr:acetyl-CoA carboxylase biotin carboxylase subunit [Bacteroidales bacterium]